MGVNKFNILVLVLLLLSLAACAPRIHGTLELLNPDMTPVEGESPEGTVVNMINTSVSVEEASHAAMVDAEGKFESAKDAIKPGQYKVEASRIGYETQTVEVEIGSMTSKKLGLQLKKIAEGKRKSIERSNSDEDKIINPGEVNIQPPMM